MNKIYTRFSKSLHSFILLPLLVTNITGSVDQKMDIPLVPVIEDKIKTSFGLNDYIDETEALIKERKIKAAKIDAYFAQWNLPLEGHGMEMVLAAEKHGIDWRLLPALAKLETTGGKNLCKNPKASYNPFGYGSCQIGFDSFEESFDVVARTLSGNSPKTAHLYAGKSVPEILEVYNPPQTKGISKNYHKNALSIMDTIDNMEIEEDSLDSILVRR